MKNNILIIVLVTIVALGVIATVILLSVLNNSYDPSQGSGSDDPNSNSYVMTEPSDHGSDSIYSVDSSGSSVDENGIGSNIVNTAVGILEREPKVPFLENGATLEGFDNSGFIYYVLRENGFMTCPRTLNEQTKMAARLELNEIKRGDLVFFCNEDDNSKAGFGGIYIGDGKMIACLVPGTFVQEVDISEKYYAERFYCGVSLS